MAPLWDRLLKWAEAELLRLRRDLPPSLQERLDGVAVYYLERPGEELLDDGIAEDTMGLFEGPAFSEEALSSDLSPSVSLFLLNIWDEAEGRERRYRTEVRLTLLHELGHYLGLDEEGLADRDLE